MKAICLGLKNTAVHWTTEFRTSKLHKMPIGQSMNIRFFTTKNLTFEEGKNQFAGR